MLNMLFFSSHATPVSAPTFHQANFVKTSKS
jgi:hypothetical protein